MKFCVHLDGFYQLANYYESLYSFYFLCKKLHVSFPRLKRRGSFQKSWHISERKIEKMLLAKHVKEQEVSSF